MSLSDYLGAWIAAVLLAFYAGCLCGFGWEKLLALVYSRQRGQSLRRLDAARGLARRWVIDRATGRVGVCCCLGSEYAGVRRGFIEYVGIQTREGDHLRVPLTAVRVALREEIPATEWEGGGE